MRVKELQVRRYGPLAPFDGRDLQSFTVLHGPNEKGKTLIVDALIRFLFPGEIAKRGRSRLFGGEERNIGRVTEDPEGYVVLRIRERDVVLGAAGISAHLPFEASLEDFRNVFVVRDSEVSTGAGSDYYVDVMQRLTGIRAGDVARVKGTAQKLGRLRSASGNPEFSNNADTQPPHMADLVDRVDELVADMTALGCELATTAFDHAVELRARAREHLDHLAVELEEQRMVERRRRYRNAEQQLAQVQKLDEEIGTLGAVAEGDLRRWHECEMALGAVDAEMERCREELVQLSGESDEFRDAGRRAQQAANVAEEQWSRARDALLPAIESVARERTMLGDAGDRTTAAWIVAGAAAAGVSGLFAFTARPTSWAVAVSLVFFGLAAIAAIWMLRDRKRRRRAAAEERRLCDRARDFVLEASDVDRVRVAIGRLDDARVEALECLRGARLRCEAIDEDRGRLLERARGIATRRDEASACYRALKAQFAVDDVSVLEESLRRRRGLERDRAVATGTLRGYIDDAASGPAGPIESCAARIRVALAETESVDGRAFAAGAVGRVEAEIRGAEAELRRLDGLAESGRSRLVRVVERAATLGILDEVPRCRTGVELAGLQARIEQWRDDVRGQRDIAARAIAILDEMESDERRKVEALFGRDQAVSKWFREITDGRYPEVQYDEATRAITVVEADGNHVAAAALSGGAFDQLHLCVRLAVAEKLMGGAPGFLVLDDPFIKSDKNRLARQLDVLRRFVAAGWQVIFVTAKDEVVTALSADIESGTVKRIELGQADTLPLSAPRRAAGSDASQRQMYFQPME